MTKKSTDEKNKERRDTQIKIAEESISGSKMRLRINSKNW